MLPVLEPSSCRADRTRLLCHEQLTRQLEPPTRRFVLERAILLGFGALYVSSLAFNAIRILTVR